MWRDDNRGSGALTESCTRFSTERPTRNSRGPWHRARAYCGPMADIDRSEGTSSSNRTPARSTDRPLRVVCGADHAGVHLKDALVEHLRAEGVDVTDLGTHGDEHVDYPDYGTAVGRAVAAGEADFGVAVCGSGTGIGMAANKIRGIRAATVTDATTARLTRRNTDANVICLGAAITGVEPAKDAVDTFLSTDFAGGDYCVRVDKLDAL